MSSALDSWSALSTQAAVVLSGFAPMVALIAGLGFITIVGFFFTRLLRGEGGSAGGGRGVSGSGAPGGVAAGLGARAGRSAHRRASASAVRKEIRKAPVVNDWASLEARAKSVNGWNGKYGDDARVKP